MAGARRARVKSALEASGCLVAPPVFKTGGRRAASSAGSIPVRLRIQNNLFGAGLAESQQTGLARRSMALRAAVILSQGRNPSKTTPAALTAGSFRRASARPGIRRRSNGGRAGHQRQDGRTGFGIPSIQYAGVDLLHRAEGREWNGRTS